MSQGFYSYNGLKQKKNAQINAVRNYIDYKHLLYEWF